jgi:hypothetical protein
VGEFRFLGTTVTNENFIQEEIKRRPSSGKAFYHSVQNLLSFHLLSKSLKIRIYRTTSIVLSVVRYECDTWSLTLLEEHRMRVFENEVLKGILGPMRNKVTGGWRKQHNDELCQV